MEKESPKIHSTWLNLRQPDNFKRFFEGQYRLACGDGIHQNRHRGERPLHRVPSDQLIWDNLHIPDEQKHRTAHPLKDRIYYVEWRSTGASRVKVYGQTRPVGYADYRIGLLYISPFDLFVDGEPVITKLKKKRKAKNDVVDLFGDD